MHQVEQFVDDDHIFHEEEEEDNLKYDRGQYPRYSYPHGRPRQRCKSPSSSRRGQEEKIHQLRLEMGYEDEPDQYNAECKPEETVMPLPQRRRFKTATQVTTQQQPRGNDDDELDEVVAVAVREGVGKKEEEALPQRARFCKTDKPSVMEVTIKRLNKHRDQVEDEIAGAAEEEDEDDTGSSHHDGSGSDDDGENGRSSSSSSSSYGEDHDEMCNEGVNGGNDEEAEKEDDYSAAAAASSSEPAVVLSGAARKAQKKKQKAADKRNTFLDEFGSINFGDVGELYHPLEIMEAIPMSMQHKARLSLHREMRRTRGRLHWTPKDPTAFEDDDGEDGCQDPLQQQRPTTTYETSLTLATTTTPSSRTAITAPATHKARRSWTTLSLSGASQGGLGSGPAHHHHHHHHHHHQQAQGRAAYEQQKQQAEMSVVEHISTIENTIQLLHSMLPVAPQDDMWPFALELRGNCRTLVKVISELLPHVHNDVLMMRALEQIEAVRLVEEDTVWSPAAQ